MSTPQIKVFRMSRLSMGACCSFHKGVLKRISDTGAEVLHVEPLVPGYEALIEKLELVLNRQKAFLATPVIRKRDKRRDNGAGYIKMAVQAALTSLIEKKRLAAQRLSIQLRQFKAVGRHQYDQATAEVWAMLRILDEPGNAAAIAALHLAEDVEALREANAACDEMMRMKAEEYASLAEQMNTNSGEVIDALNTRYGDIVRLVNAHAIVTPIPAITDFVLQTNAHIENMNFIIAHSGSGQN